MATQAELQKAVDDAQANALEKRAAWKAAIPGGDAKMSVDEQTEVDALEAVYVTAKNVRKAAEQNLANWSPPAPVHVPPSKSAGASVDDLKVLGYI